jgi:poly(hydroxyalkanoate) granule-associated protein
MNKGVQPMPTNTKAESTRPNPHHSTYPLLEAARKVLLAGIGAMALAQDEIEEFVDRLVERGEIAEKDGRKLVREIMEKRMKDADLTEEDVAKKVESVLHRMNVPTKSDIESLTEKIAILTKKVDDLKKG